MRLARRWVLLPGQRKPVAETELAAGQATETAFIAFNPFDWPLRPLSFCKNWPIHPPCGISDPRIRAERGAWVVHRTLETVQVPGGLVAGIVHGISESRMTANVETCSWDGT